MCSMSRHTERFFFVFTYVIQGASYMSPTAYAVMHRLHHAHTDTEDDPHSPHYTRHMLDMVLRSRTVYRHLLKSGTGEALRYKRNVPEWKTFDRWATSNLSSLVWIVVYVVIYAGLHASVWQYALLPVTASMTVIQGAIVNWFAHKTGYVNYELADKSGNLLPVDFLFLGEAYHNNHHRWPGAPNYARKPFELDMVYHIMRFFAWLGVIKMRTV